MYGMSPPMIAVIDLFFQSSTVLIYWMDYGMWRNHEHEHMTALVNVGQFIGTVSLLFVYILCVLIL